MLETLKELNVLKRGSERNVEEVWRTADKGRVTGGKLLEGSSNQKEGSVAELHKFEHIKDKERKYERRDERKDETHLL